MNREGIARVREIMAEPISEELFANPVWRIGNLYTCITKEGVEVQFVPNDAQCDVLNEVFLEGHKRVLILKARQLGMSTLIAIIGLDYVLTHESSTFNIQSHNDEAAKDLLREKVIQPFNQLDDSLKATVDVVNSNLNELVFSLYGRLGPRSKFVVARARSCTYRNGARLRLRTRLGLRKSLLELCLPLGRMP